jgi:hypothetical protein
MEAPLLERMREDLLQKQDNLTEWLHATPLGKKKVMLGPSTEHSVHARINVIDDAIWEAHNLDGKIFGKERLYEIIRQNATNKAEKIIEAVIAAVSQFQNDSGSEDDITLVVIKIDGDLGD